MKDRDILHLWFSFGLCPTPVAWKGKMKGKLSSWILWFEIWPSSFNMILHLAVKSEPNTDPCWSPAMPASPESRGTSGPRITGAQAEMSRRKKTCAMLSALHRLHHLHTREEKMANIYFFGHPFPTTWDTQVWALESTELDKPLLMIFLLNSNMNSSWFHPRADQKLLKSWELW